MFNSIIEAIKNKWRDWTGGKEQPYISPIPADAAVNTPTPTPNVPQAILDFNKYIPKGSPFHPTQPPPKIANEFFSRFGASNEATPAALVGWSENAGWNPNARNINNNGTIDRGLTQINSQTFNEMMNKRRYREQLNGAGIYTAQDLYDPIKNIAAHKVTHQYEQDAGVRPWRWWYGWQNKHFKIK